jgi:hypothetical protein
MALTSRSDQLRELASAVINGTITDEDGVALAASDIQGMLVTLYDDASGSIINNRLRQSVLNTNQVTIDSNGVLTWTMRPADNVIVGSVSVGEVEQHVAHFEWAYGGTAVALTNAFATTDTDNTVTVTAASHGLAVGDSVFITGCADVGGLNVNGLRVVATVPTAGSFTFEHPTAATATEAAGGGVSVNVVKNATIGRQDVGITVLQFAKVPGP